MIITSQRLHPEDLSMHFVKKMQSVFFVIYDRINYFQLAL